MNPRRGTWRITGSDRRAAVARLKYRTSRRFRQRTKIRPRRIDSSVQTRLSQQTNGDRKKSAVNKQRLAGELIRKKDLRRLQTWTRARTGGGGRATNARAIFLSP